MKNTVKTLANGIAVATLTVSLSACVNTSPYVEVGSGFNESFFAESAQHKWDDGGAGPLGARFGVGIEGEVMYNPNLRAGCEYIHFSQWFVGPPINDKAESSLDHIGCKVRYTFK